MPLILGASGARPEKAVDMEIIVNEWPLPMLCMMVTLLQFALETDVSAFAELYGYAANRYNDLDPVVRREASYEGDERYFTIRARERYEREHDEARKIGKDTGLIIGGSGNGK